jgi:hypothetical protein
VVNPLRRSAWSAGAVARAMILPAAVLSPRLHRPGRGIGYVVCMRPAAWPEPDPLIAAAIAARYSGKRPRPLAVQVRDRLGQWLEDEQFAARSGTGAVRAGRRRGWRW